MFGGRQIFITWERNFLNFLLLELMLVNWISVTNTTSLVLSSRYRKIGDKILRALEMDSFNLILGNGLLFGFALLVQFYMNALRYSVGTWTTMLDRKRTRMVTMKILSIAAGGVSMPASSRWRLTNYSMIKSTSAKEGRPRRPTSRYAISFMVYSLKSAILLNLLWRGNVALWAVIGFSSIR